MIYVYSHVACLRFWFYKYIYIVDSLDMNALKRPRKCRASKFGIYKDS